ncbi:MAG: hypothetical protein GY807_06425, partial [Gammaproteobacteria bacterium]|nr:hypothetical protein [Gammaproteobacteria bacterium]
LPAISLRELGAEAHWQPERDLLNSTSNDKVFAVEVEADGVAYLRFGDDRFGARPNPNTRFHATYRIGNGTAGNVGAETLAHLVTGDPALVPENAKPPIISVANPLPARGGSQAESIEQVRRSAPHAYRAQERAVSPDDYAVLAKRCRLDMQRAAATVRWTGSWHTVFGNRSRVKYHEFENSWKESDMAAANR